MKRAWLLLALLVLVAAAAGLLLFRGGRPPAAAQSRRVATRGLAEYLASRYPGSRAIVVSNPFTQRRGLAKAVYAQEKASIRGIEEGLGGAIELKAVVFPELRPEALQDPSRVEIDASSPTPLSYLMADGAFDHLLQEHPDCDLVISLVGMPLELGRVEAWRASSPVRFALLFPDLRMLGSRASIRDAVRSGKLAAFVLPRPDPPDGESPAAGEYRTDFERHFILVTPETIDRVVESYPGLFTRIGAAPAPHGPTRMTLKNAESTPASRGMTAWRSLRTSVTGEKPAGSGEGAISTT